jgi:N-acetylglucosaminyl-diphospho-decaprenol L-rhamnosyltransferase
MNPIFSLSIVSHGHSKHIKKLLSDLARIRRNDFEVILTLNMPEELEIDINGLPFHVIIIANELQKGFAENNNAAFTRSKGMYFVLLNPDIMIETDPFGEIVNLLTLMPDAICAPSITDSLGHTEDSVRNFPTPLSLFKKLLYKIFGYTSKIEKIPTDDDLLRPDWVAGMFVVIPRYIYEQLSGLSENYFLYYEDVDFCARAKLAGYQILVLKSVSVIHNAQRSSHRELKYLIWHLQSILRFFMSKAFLRIQFQQIKQKF